MIKESLFLVLALIAALIWIAHTRKYAAALLTITSLGGIYSCIVGASAIHNGKLWFGAVTVAMGAAALICVAVILMRLRSQAATKSNGSLIASAVMAGLLFPVSVTSLQTRAPDFWAYLKLGMTDPTTPSPVFFVEVCGVGHRPTIAYIVRCADPSGVPQNFLDVSQSVTHERDKRTRVMDRWRSECKVLVGRKVGETIEIPLDRATVQKWFGRGAATIGDFGNCQMFWDQFVSPRLAELDRNVPGAG